MITITEAYPKQENATTTPTFEGNTGASQVLADEIGDGDPTDAEIAESNAVFWIDPDTEKFIMALASGKQNPKKVERQTLLGAVRVAVANGLQPPQMDIASGTNMGYAKRAFALYKLMLAGNLAGLEAEKVGGSNCYSRAIREYQTLLIAHLKG
jgi:hypothetical protein